MVGPGFRIIDLHRSQLFGQVARNSIALLVFRSFGIEDSNDLAELDAQQAGLDASRWELCGRMPSGSVNHFFVSGPETRC